ncbi:hypothetical protein ACFDR9_002775 [Janthinobacterium sp. CG_23.3]|uniref:DUF4405 domain-containing protein n=1 Tax=unclassified Janthinobacterium TaxID=2610881 RepID=UPI00034CCEA0|nr:MULTISPECIES: DUF4405 domain-containing protein [unclassified Janthinobacterium]MEC5161819.1 hypothetical protein [Janthinobacterium sp. CG_S6]
MPSTKPATAAHARHHVNLRLERWHRRCVYLSCAALFASGVAWLLARYCLRAPGQFGETIHPLEPWAMKTHGAAAMVTLFFLGSLMNAHIRRALKAGRNLASGWAMIATFALLVVSGFGLYYLAGESDRPLWSALHWVVGLALGALTVLHIVLGRRANPSRGH